MGVDRDKFSGEDPNSFDAARAAADAPIGYPLNPEAHVGDEQPTDVATDGNSNGNAAAHVDGGFTAGMEDPASEPSAPDRQLCPNRVDINKHLYALFHPDFVKSYPDAWIEIAYANPAVAGGLRAAEQFSAFDLEPAGDFAERQNRKGFNIYVGVALRQGETPASSNGRASGANVLTACRAWTDFDSEGDAERVSAILKEKNIQAAEVVTTGTIPFRRFQVHFELLGKPSEDGLDPGNPTADELTAVNTALKELLGGDTVQNADRVMRLAGTVSYPSPSKVERGYVPELVRLRVMEPSRAYHIVELSELATGAADPSREYGIASGARSGRNRSYKSSGKSQVAEARARPRTDSELAALLETSRTPGKWYVSIRSATATMIGRGLTDAEIRSSCAPHCTGGFDDSDLDDFLDRGRTKWNVPDGASVERLARLTSLKYDQQRKAAAKELGIRVSVLDRMVGDCRGRGQEDEVDDQLAEINSEYALVLAGNKAAVMKFEDNTRFRLLQVGAFKQWFANQLVMFGKKAVSVGDLWLGHTERRQYDGIEFAPPGSATRTGYYNLFQGFGVEPGQGDCSKFLAHLKDNAARGDEATYLWIVGWWAQIVQQPSVKMATALVLRGPFGVGKTKIGQVMGSLIGDHYLLVASPRYITGQFNSHMASLLVLHADEAFWAGDKASVGTLRDLVSGDHHMLEYKNVDPIRIKNHMRLFVTGNPDWMVPAGFRERRWAVFDMGEGHMQDHAYFAAIDHEMNDGGREALLHYLLNFDLSQVDLRTIPKTAALLDQQIESMTPEQAWWFQTLMSGVLPPRPYGINGPHVCQKDDLFERYVRHTRIQGVRHRSIEVKIGKFLHAQLGATLKDTRPIVGDQRLRCYELPPLKDCRQLFASGLGQPVDWGEGWESEEWQHGRDGLEALRLLGSLGKE